jgi:carbon monoxide dehydrogenase subunit G
MEFDNSFEVPLPPADAWKVLLDIQRIAPCMPGAELTEVVGDNTYKGKIGVRLGPVALTFAGIVKFDEIDDAKHTARVSAQGTDAAPTRHQCSAWSRPAAGRRCWCTPT